MCVLFRLLKYFTHIISSIYSIFVFHPWPFFFYLPVMSQIWFLFLWYGMVLLIGWFLLKISRLLFFPMLLSFLPMLSMNFLMSLINNVISLPLLKIFQVNFQMLPVILTNLLYMCLVFPELTLWKDLCCLSIILMFLFYYVTIYIIFKMSSLPVVLWVSS